MQIIGTATTPTGGDSDLVAEAVPSIFKGFSTFEDLEISNDMTLTPGLILDFNDGTRLVQPVPFRPAGCVYQIIFFPQEPAVVEQLRGPIHHVIERIRSAGYHTKGTEQRFENFDIEAERQRCGEGVAIEGNVNRNPQFRGESVMTPSVCITEGDLTYIVRLLPREEEFWQIAEQAIQLTEILIKETTKLHKSNNGILIVSDLIDLTDIAIYAVSHASENPRIGFEDVDKDTGERIVRWINLDAIRTQAMDETRGKRA